MHDTKSVRDIGDAFRSFGRFSAQAGGSLSDLATAMPQIHQNEKKEKRIRPRNPKTKKEKIIITSHLQDVGKKKQRRVKIRKESPNGEGGLLRRSREAYDEGFKSGKLVGYEEGVGYAKDLYGVKTHTIGAPLQLAPHIRGVNTSATHAYEYEFEIDLDIHTRTYLLHYRATKHTGDSTQPTVRTGYVSVYQDMFTELDRVHRIGLLVGWVADVVRNTAYYVDTLSLLDALIAFLFNPDRHYAAHNTANITADITDGLISQEVRVGVLRVLHIELEDIGEGERRIPEPPRAPSMSDLHY